MSWLTVIVISLICAGICTAIAQRKNLSVRDSFALGCGHCDPRLP
jgi:hypothetical protein